ncbi:alpha-1,2-mannosyltransferase [Schizosaccharomyces japonicus yFS275]|uniref:Mannosyltransferase n=1 Tax=Schizosaccharomyces japonicus (strain yFS275 / FY16936) TaxID=402676 RepID=B6K5A8_SCHJY|nr:alpha-1,2-mannosyltransferase [Schizosaccharomyces japonicus yFS275]EEB08712.1 alpha-1,2-mannosyltransferase [Schizosaccharomyces japonicus yFS275]
MHYKQCIAYAVLLVLRALFSVSPSYIHPDEQLQSLQVVSQYVFGWKAELPWEYTVERPIRSLVPLLITTFLPMEFVKTVFGASVKPTIVFHVCRLWMLLLSLCVDYCIWLLFPPKTRVRALLGIGSTMMMLVYQTKTLSNSFEVILSLLAFVLFRRVSKKIQKEPSKTPSFDTIALCAVCTLGVFTRITFPAFLLPSALSALRTWRQCLRPQHLLWFCSKLIFICLLFTTAYLFIDSYVYGKPVFTVWNNLMYNSQTGNLAQHGLHARWTHLLINVPLLCGPILAQPSLWNPMRSAWWYLMVPIALLSVFPHQEARFLLPACVFFTAYAFSITHSKLLLVSSLIYHTFLSMFYGVLHQRGVVPTLSKLADYYSSCSPLSEPGSAMSMYFWRVYTPPTWMLKRTGHENVEVDTQHFVGYSRERMEEILFKKFISTQSSRPKTVLECPPFLFICPKVLLSNPEAWNLTLYDSVKIHYDLDDLDEVSLTDIIQHSGIGIYKPMTLEATSNTDGA